MPHDFHSDDISANLAARFFELDNRAVPAEQYYNFDYAEISTDGFDGFDKVWNTLSPVIGQCLIVFSELEIALEQNLYELISDRSDQLGMLTARQMSYMQKVNLYIDLLRLRLHARPQAHSDIARLKSHLVRAAEVRNIIAHAKWPSITNDGYVFSTVDAINGTTDIPDMHYYRLNKSSLDDAFIYISAVGNMPHYIHEKYVSA